MEVNIQDNFLAEEEFGALRDVVTGASFPWYFSPVLVDDDEAGSPGLFFHVAFDNMKLMPTPELYNPLVPMLRQLDVAVLLRIKINLNTRLPEPYYSHFHSDTTGVIHEDIATQFTTSILYMNTNNGYTEIENGEEDTRVESVANRVVSFPSNLEHRGVTQTDEQGRYVINFNYLKRRENT